MQIDENTVPLGVPLIAQFQYLQDCQVKLPVSIKERNQRFYMKSPVRPFASWNMDVIIRAIDFFREHPIKLFKSPFGETEFWNSTVIRKVARSQYSEIFEISPPVMKKIISKRQSRRFFLLAPVKCYFGDWTEEINTTEAICVDISETGFGLKFQGRITCAENETIRIAFHDQELLEISGKIVRTSYNILDQSTTVGLALEEVSKKNARQIISVILQRQQEKDSKSDAGTEVQEAIVAGSSSNFTNEELFELFKQQKKKKSQEG